VRIARDDSWRTGGRVHGVGTLTWPLRLRYGYR
jgi:hypothetical protein